MSKSRPLLSGLGQIALVVHDLPAAIRFYRDVLGLDFLFEAPPHMAFFDCGGIRLMLSLPEDEQFDHPPSILYFRVDDIQSVHRLLREEGVVFIHEPRLVAPMPDHDLWMAFFRDMEGNPLALMSEVPRDR